MAKTVQIPHHHATIRLKRGDIVRVAGVTITAKGPRTIQVVGPEGQTIERVKASER